MTLLDKIKESYKHMYWADGKIWQTVLTLPQAQDHERMKKILHHLHITQLAFYQIWADLKMDLPRRKEFNNLTELAEWAFKNIDLLQSFISGLKEEDLEKIIKIPWSKHSEKHLGIKAADINLAETMFQVLEHSTYHRGQVNALIRVLDAEPPAVDYIVWVWKGKPPSNWPESVYK